LGLFKQCQLLQSYYVVASWLLGGDLVSGEMVSSWWRDDRKPRFYRLRERVHVVRRPSNPAPKGAPDVHISRNYILNRCVLSVPVRRDWEEKAGGGSSNSQLKKGYFFQNVSNKRQQLLNCSLIWWCHSLFTLRGRWE